MAVNAAILAFPVSPVQSTDAAIEAKLSEYLRLKEQAKQYEKVKPEIKALFKGEESLAIGRFKVTGKEVSQPEKTIKAFSYWDVRVSLSQ